MSKRKFRTVFLASTLSLALLAGCGGQGKPTGSTPAVTPTPAPAAGASGANVAKPEMTKLTISTPTTDINFLPIFVAAEKQFFKDFGLDVTVISFQGDRENVQALLSGASQLSSTAFTEVIDSQIQNAGLTSFYPQSTSPAYVWISSSGIKSMADAKAKKAKFAISKPGSLTDTLTRWAIKKAGFDPDKDFEIVPVGGPPERWAALKANRVDVAIVTPPITYDADRAGFNRLMSLSDFTASFAMEDWIAKEEFLKKNPETVKTVLRAYFKAVNFLNDDKNLNESAQIICKKIGVCDQDFAIRTVKEMRAHFPKDGTYSDEGAKFLIQTFVDKGALKSIPELSVYRYPVFVEYFKAHPEEWK